MKKILSQALILSFTFANLLSPALALGSNYVPVSSTTTEIYSASSPVGRFETHNGNYTPPTYVSTYPVASYDVYGNVVVQPTVNYAYPETSSQNPVYAAQVNYQPQNTYNSNIQDIEVPQTYEKTVSNNVNYVDPREKADKVIDRGVKVLGTLAVGAAAVGLILLGLQD